MKRFLATALLLAAIAPVAVTQPCFSPSDITGLGVETLAGEYTIWYSPGYRSHADRIAEEMPGLRDFIRNEFGVDPDFAVALLDEQDWNTLRLRRPVCNLGEFGTGRIDSDKLLTATPIEEDGIFEHCLRMLDRFSTNELDEFSRAAGTYPTVACYDFTRSAWIKSLGSSVLYPYLLPHYYRDPVWPVFVNGWFIGTSILSHMLPTVARIDSVAATAFRLHQSQNGTYETPAVQVFEENRSVWLQGDKDHFQYYLDWFTELGYGRNAKFGTAFIDSVRERLRIGGDPDSTKGWTALYESVEAGLESILLESEDGPAELPASVELESAYPNPFNPSTTAVYSLPTPARVELSLHDLVGRVVRRVDLGYLPAGRHETPIDAGGLASGVYLLRLTAGTEVRTRAVTLRR